MAPNDESEDDRPNDDDLHFVTAKEELDEGDRLLVDIREREIAVFNVDGEYHAIANYCVHQGGPICEGLLSGTVTAEMTDDGWELGYDRENEILSCPWHGWEFDVKTGEHLSHSGYQLVSYEVIEQNGDLYVSL